MAAGTPVDLAILQSLETQLETISVANGDETDVEEVRLSDIQLWEFVSVPSIFINPLNEGYDEGVGGNNVVGALNTTMRVQLQMATAKTNTPIEQALKLKRDVHQSVEAWRLTKPAGAVDVEFAGTQYGTYKPDAGVAVFVTVTDLVVFYRADLDNLNNTQ